MKQQMQYKNTLPVLPLRDVVVFPRVVLSLYVGRTLSLRALKKAMEDGGQVFLVTQKKGGDRKPRRRRFV
jgi:ATP-dependent Lon protease